MFWKKKESNQIPWEDLNSIEQLDQLNELSVQQPVLIFKHSTRCSISFMAKSRFETNFEETNMSIWLLDLIKHRDVSNKIAEVYGIQHESPQVLLIKDGKCIYSTSHNGIDFKRIKEEL